MYGIATGGMRLRFLTAASDATEKTEFRLMNSSKGSEAIVVLGDTPYYESLEASMKIRKYVKQRNVSQMPKSAQDIIRGQQEEAAKYEAEASKALVEAIENAKFYADGEHLDIKSGNAKAKIDQTMEYLVSHVYSKLDLIGKNADTDADILAVLSVRTIFCRRQIRTAMQRRRWKNILRCRQCITCRPPWRMYRASSAVYPMAGRKSTLLMWWRV